MGVDLDYPSWVFFLDATGLQAWSLDYGIPPINGPLWSLSVEIYLSASVLVIGHRRRMPSILLFLFLIALALIGVHNTIVQALPIFYVGYLLPDLRINNSMTLLIRLPIAAVPFFAILISPKILQGQYSHFWNLFISYFFASLILVGSFCFASLDESKISAISQRSYPLYAVHAPIILFVDQYFFPMQSWFSYQQFLLSIVCIFVATETVYQFIEKPSIYFSRQFLVRKNLKSCEQPT
jgi:peptidoglycan/LPS O-acetylase OafA/YrhL